MPEPWGTWSTGVFAEVVVLLSEAIAESLTVKAIAGAFTHASRPIVEVDVFANRTLIDRWEFRHGEGPAERTAIVPRDVIGPAGVLRLEFVPVSRQSPKEAGQSEDPRELGISLVNLRLIPSRGIP